MCVEGCIMDKNLILGACVFVAWFTEGFYADATQKVSAEVDVPSQTMTVRQYGATLYN